VQTATLPLAALTAWQALVDHAGLKAGERVLVQGGAGGVGVYAVQLAAVLGGQVTATGRGPSEAFVRDLGAGRSSAPGRRPAPDRAELARLAGLTDAGQLRPVVSQVFPLADGRQAYASRVPGRPPGKTVLAVR
jgi:NADPH:quinone reductase-like Zn-dependent oxidoreductase